MHILQSKVRGYLTSRFECSMELHGSIWFKATGAEKQATRASPLPLFAHSTRVGSEEREDGSVDI